MPLSRTYPSASAPARATERSRPSHRTCRTPAATASLAGLTTAQQTAVRRWVFGTLALNDPKSYDPVTQRSRTTGARLLCTDFDLTLANTRIDFPLRHRENNEQLHFPKSHPKAGEPVFVGRGPRRDPTADFAALKSGFCRKDFPELYGDDVFVDHSPLRDEQLLADSEPITIQTATLREEAARAPALTKTFILTGRADVESVHRGTQRFAEAQGLKISALFAVGKAPRSFLDAVLPDADYGLRKAAVLEALLAIHPGAELHFADNDPAYLAPAVEQLWRAHPEVDMHFWGMAHTGTDAVGEDRFALYPLAAFTRTPGESERRLRHPVSQTPIANPAERLDCYASREVPFF